ncbi:tensin-1-like isoform X3 [Bolinopsis microptera]|uniref:tensin-1-like isoform X3 n=1 Tax=Bolinopsis microptera TaxID=2820187 RepID=UPI003079BA9B
MNCFKGASDEALLTRCPACKIRCHRLCSDRAPPKCVKLSPKLKKPKDHPGSARGFDLLRRKVGENKMRYVDEKYDLDLSYITPRIIAMSYPAQGLEAAYRNKLKDVAELLESKHKDKYLIINVSDRSYDTSFFKNQVVEFGWPDHHAPSMNLLICIVKTMDSWLREDPDHVIVCHCKGGKGRTGVAIAAYIQFSNRNLTPEEALGKFADKRFYEESLGGVTQPSQRRMVHYFSSILKNEIQLENRQLILNTLILFGCPQIDGKHGAKICFCVYEGLRLVHTTKVYGVTPDREHVYINFDNLKLQSDVMIKAFHIGKTGQTCILRVQFHTAFVKKDYSMVFRKKDIDIACRDDRFPDDGVLQVIFKPRASVVTDTLDSSAHHSLITDQKEAQELEQLTQDISLMSFDYADFSSFFTDNPLSESLQNELVDGILQLHDDYKLISPLLPFSPSPPPSSDQDSGKGESPPAGAPPPLPPKGKNKDISPRGRDCSLNRSRDCSLNRSREKPLPRRDNSLPSRENSVPNRDNSLPKRDNSLPKSKEARPKSREMILDNTARPALPPRSGARPPPPENANILTSYLVESKEEVDYLSFEIATPVRNLVEHFEREDETNNFEKEDENNNFVNWVKFDEEDEEIDDALIDLKTPPGTMSPPDAVFKDKSLERPCKSKLAASASEPAEGCQNRRSAHMDRDRNKHTTVERKTKSLELNSENTVDNTEKEKGKGDRKSTYIPYLRRKESIKKDKSGKKQYVPYKNRTDSFGTNSRSSSESSGSFLSPPPLPPRGDKAAPGPGFGPTTNATLSQEMYCDSDDNLAVPPRRLGSLSKSMDHLPSSNKVSMEFDTRQTSDPDSVEFSLQNWERAQKRMIIQQTKTIWFRPDISRQESQATLVSQCPGAFIIRTSQTKPNSFGLTIRLDDGQTHEKFDLHPGSHKVSNFLILRKDNRNLFINGYNDVDFLTLEDLVEHFTNHTGGLPHPLCVPTQPYADRIEKVVPMLLRNVNFPVFILEKRCIRYLPLDSFEEDNVKTLLNETISQLDVEDVRLISMSVTKHGITLTDPDCVLFDVYSIPYKQIKNCEIGSREQIVSLPNTYSTKTASTFGLIHRDKDSEIIYIALAEYEDKGIFITKTINKFRSYLV